MVINKKFPSFKLEFQTEEKEYAVKYNTKYKADSGLIEPRVLGFQSKNAMQDDSKEIENIVKEFLKLEKPTPEIMKVIINKIEIHQDKQVDIIFNFKRLNDINIKNAQND